MLTVLKALETGGRKIRVSGLRAGAAAYLAARAATRLRQPLLCIVAGEDEVAPLEQDIALFTSIPVIAYPGYEIPPYTPLSPDSATITARLAALYRVFTAEGPSIMVASVEALLRRVLPLERLSNLAELVIANEEYDREALIRTLINCGYEQVSLVQSPGEFTLRGGIIDIFPPPLTTGKGDDITELPVRLDFFGDTVESIRHFDPLTQRSNAELEEIVILPVSETLFTEQSTAQAQASFKALARKHDWQQEEGRRILEQIAIAHRFPGIEFFLPLFHEKLATPLDALAENTVIFAVNPEEIEKTARLTWERITANFQEAERLKTPALPPETLFMPRAELWKKLASQRQIELADFSGPEPAGPDGFALHSGNHLLLKQELSIKHRNRTLLAPLVDQIKSWQENHGAIGFSCRSLRHAGQLAELLAGYRIKTEIVEKKLLEAPPGPDKLLLYPHPLSAGFDLPEENFHLLSEGELLGRKRLGPKKEKRAASAVPPLRFEELHQGDIVVHSDHGLGIYQGMTTMTLNGIVNDFLQISYKDNDNLYVPVDRLAAVSKYQGISDRQPKIDSLGGKSWPKAKKKVKEAVWKVARELLDLYARRQLATGTRFSPPDHLFHELEESFPFDETPGQLKAINDALDDLSSERTMDRLICGDVGYGKTEVAIRAAFKVILDNYQVAVLVPTTVLAEQHLESFRDRLGSFPLRIESLSRFRSQAEQKKIISGMADGSVDLVIGTHRLLSKDVVFKKLGLLIIDEEHRFGVSHKEKLKKLRRNVDVLTLTATPIPRTLQLSLLGVRDLSVISSPPRHRRTIKTFVARHDDLVIKEAINRELRRRGQVFIVHNRVQSIHEMARKVQKLAPEARIAVGHGQMAAKNLEEIMLRFVNREIDVLVCTTIIESGLDIPNANTIIVTRADRFGLAAIYQLRGRVGRSSEQAYAYLLVPSLDGLSKDARQRLRALMDYNELGGGFKLAMSDLQIRGGGNILGESQSGNIAAVGYDLYLDLLQRTVEDLKRRELRGEAGELAEIEPEINLGVSAYIPEIYVADTDQRYIAYRKISSLSTPAQTDDLEEEMRDRYGPLPPETVNLLRVILFKMELRRLKVLKLDKGPDALVFTFHEQTPVDPAALLLLIRKSKGKMRLTPDNRLIVKQAMQTDSEVFATVSKTLNVLAATVAAGA